MTHLTNTDEANIIRVMVRLGEYFNRDELPVDLAAKVTRMHHRAPGKLDELLSASGIEFIAYMIEVL